MKRFILHITAAVLLVGCGSVKQLASIKENGISSALSIPNENEAEDLVAQEPQRDTLTVVDDDIIIMRAMRDENGEMVATDVINTAVVTARFKNIAERNGKVEIHFDIAIPKELQNSRWQIRMYPGLHLDSTFSKLDTVLITGQDYRNEQLKGYQQYRKFISTIITDPYMMMDTKQFEVFIKRNIPQLYRMKTDSTYVSKEEFTSIFGVGEMAAIEHYTSKYLRRKNNLKISNKEKRFSKYVKSPIQISGVRLDTVLSQINGDFIYSYIQPINVSSATKKARIELWGEIYDQEKLIYVLPSNEPLTYYISSISTLADASEKYIEKTDENNMVTTILDTNYISGVQAIKDRDYKTAVTKLRSYKDYNSAVAFCAMNMNASAMAILENLEITDKVEYLKAIIYSRLNDDKQAVQCFLNACSMNRSFINRGNLDPEISSIIKKYRLNIYD